MDLFLWGEERKDPSQPETEILGSLLRGGRVIMSYKLPDDALNLLRQAPEYAISQALNISS